MPRLDGILATRRVLATDPGLRVIVLTGAGEEELGLQALRAGAVDAVAKDADFDALARAVEEAGRAETAISHAARADAATSSIGSPEPGVPGFTEGLPQRSLATRWVAWAITRTTTRSTA